MTFEPWRILLFAGAGLLTIVLFSLLGTTQFRDKRVDRHTGASLPRLRTALCNDWEVGLRAAAPCQAPGGAGLGPAGVAGLVSVVG